MKLKAFERKLLCMNYILHHAYRETRNIFSILVGKPEEKGPPGRHRP
jgi:hypothetical protein